MAVGVFVGEDKSAQSGNPPSDHNQSKRLPFKCRFGTVNFPLSRELMVTQLPQVLHSAPLGPNRSLSLYSECGRNPSSPN